MLYQARIKRWRLARLAVLHCVRAQLSHVGVARCRRRRVQLLEVDHLDLGELIGVDRRRAKLLLGLGLRARRLCFRRQHAFCTQARLCCQQLAESAEQELVVRP
eukprot:6025279-Pleurochrysis_carterae.AAC.1